jgi:hypothetical protein
MTDPKAVHTIDRAIYDSHAPRVAVSGRRYGHGYCTVLWIKASDNGVPDLAVHLPTDELVTMIDRLRDKL